MLGIGKKFVFSVIAGILILSIFFSYQVEGAIPPNFWAGNGDGISFSDGKNWDRGAPDGSDLNNYIYVEQKIRLDQDLTLQNKLEIFKDGNLIVEKGKTLAIEGGKLIINNGGILENFGTIIVDGGLQYPNQEKPFGLVGPTYIPDESQGKILVKGELSVSGTIINHGELIVNENSVVNFNCDSMVENFGQIDGIKMNLICSPLKQIKNGIHPNDVICYGDLKLIFKLTDGSPACVKPSSVTKLTERGWTKST